MQKKDRHRHGERRAGCISTKLLLVSMLLLLTCLQSYAQGVLDKKSTISFPASSLTQRLKEIQHQTGITIAFDENETGEMKVPAANFSNATLKEVLQKTLTGVPFSWKLTGESVVIIAQPQAPLPKKAPGKVSGRIIDAENGQPIEGVTIRIGDQGTFTDINGAFLVVLPKGTYTANISYMGYGAKEVSGIDVNDHQTFELNATMKRQKGQLSAVVVKASAKKESIASLFTRQKNAASLSDGISAEQIAATPDKHIGETLKRITGVSTTDNRKVVVRGIAERYNVALLDGSTLPSTDVQERDFEFNLIPSNLVDNIVVAKSITPDMLYGFAGGLVQITTKSIPVSNFISVSGGLSFNSRTTGKDFYGYQRGKYDYLGYNDGSRNHFPDGLFDLSDKYDPRVPESQNQIKPPQIGEQNKRIGGTERLGTRTYKAMPSQNYQFSLGRAYSLSKTKERNLGFVGSLSYRNTQTNDYIADMRRGSWSRRPTIVGDVSDVNTGNMSGFNTTIGTLLNGGFKTGKHQISTYNLYTHIFDDRFSRIKGWSYEEPKNEDSNKFPFIQEDDRPKFSDLLQNKLSGSHQAGRVKITWNISRTHLKTLEQDAVSAALGGRELANKTPLFQYAPGQASDPGWGTLHRDQYSYRERNLAGDISAAIDVKFGKTTHTIKTGFNYLDKHAWYNWTVLPIVTKYGLDNPYSTIPIQQWGDYMSMEHPAKDLFYFPGDYSLNSFEGKSINKGAFVMFDSKLLPNLRIVWGVRADYFKLDTMKNGASRAEDRNFKLYLDDSVRTYFLPSVNITYTPVKNLNVRASYAESVVRPGLMENSRFSRYNPSYGTILRSRGVISTVIKNYDVKVEWFPGSGEIISAGYFYKYFDKPAEYYTYDQANTGKPDILITNSDWAKVRGWEFELRKNLGFIYAGSDFLENIYLSGNLTLQKSQVRARNKEIFSDANGKDSVVYSYLKYPRALYGQVPVLYNAGIQYTGKRLGLNLVYNYMGYKTFVTGSDPDFIEYERPRGQMDAQVSYKLLKGRMEAKLNMSNLMDAPHRFFINDNSTFEYKPNRPPVFAEWNDAYQYKEGFSEKFEEGYVDEKTNKQIGDRKTLTRYVGRTFSFSLSYNF
ncbi:TonB-dependent receptor domain-containing protein [Chitinophaga sp. RAB17]|uniref:TonB-dependent receptor n=1 Tax=Chitinophaga sp. RAB17 TaxID=3233049 RepID=UPI003F92CCED